MKIYMKSLIVWFVLNNIQVDSNIDHFCEWWRIINYINILQGSDIFADTADLVK